MYNSIHTITNMAGTVAYVYDADAAEINRVADFVESCDPVGRGVIIHLMSKAEQVEFLTDCGIIR